jgi:hypothetical protein
MYKIYFCNRLCPFNSYEVSRTVIIEWPFNDYIDGYIESLNWTKMRKEFVSSTDKVFVYDIIAGDDIIPNNNIVYETIIVEMM